MSERGGALEGFVCGFVEPAEFYRLMWRNKRTFALPALSALVRHPSLASGMLYGVQRIQTSASRGPARSCELSSIAVAPEAGGNGLGRALMRAFVAWASSMDAQCVYLTTDADGNEPANALLSASRIPTHAALPAAQGTLDERIRHRWPGSRRNCEVRA